MTLHQNKQVHINPRFAAAGLLELLLQKMNRCLLINQVDKMKEPSSIVCSSLTLIF